MEAVVQGVRQHTRGLVRELNVLQGVFQDTGLTYSQCHVLFELEQGGCLNLMELSRVVQLEKSTTSRLVKRLVASGLVAVRPGRADRRQKFFSLTDAGLAAVQHNNRLASAQVEAALGLLAQDQREMVLEGLNCYAKALRRSRLQKAFSFRPVAPDDNPLLARLIRSVMAEYDAIGEGYSVLDPEVDDLYRAYSTDRARYYVLLKEEAVVGGGGIGPLTGGEADTCEIRKMYFYPEARGLGLGRKLVTLCLETAQAFGFKRCYLETVERMWQANLLYQKMGFERLDRPMGQTGHSGADAWFLRALD